jgi:hypothetical protein
VDIFERFLIRLIRLYFDFISIESVTPANIHVRTKFFDSARESSLKSNLNKGLFLTIL